MLRFERNPGNVNTFLMASTPAYPGDTVASACMLRKTRLARLESGDERGLLCGIGLSSLVW